MKHILSRKPILPLVLIILLASFLRLYQLSSNPAGFFSDEASIGNNAYLLLKTGKDDTGQSWPLFFRAFGEYKSPILTYSTIPMVAIFGLNEFSTRAASAMYGVFGVVAIFLLAETLFGVEVALFSGFLLAISPWHTHLSRISLEGFSPYVFLVTLGMYFFVKSKDNIRLLPLSFLTFAIGLYTYFSARIFIPVFVLGIILLSWRNLLTHLKDTCIALFVFFIASLPLLFHIIFGPGLARWNDVSIFNQKGISSGLQQAVNNYFPYFSSDFLFHLGDTDMPGQLVKRHSIGGVGELYWIQMPFIVLALFWLIKLSSPTPRLILLWLILYPIPSIFTNAPAPSATRSVVGVIPFQILTAYGLTRLFGELDKIKFRILSKHRFLMKSLLGIGIVAFVSLSFFFFMQAFLRYPLTNSNFSGWQFGPRDIISYFTKVEFYYDDLFMAGEFNQPQSFLLFYAPNNCQKCHVGGFENYNFLKRQLFAISPGYLASSDYKNRFEVKKTIYYPNGKSAFLIGELKK